MFISQNNVLTRKVIISILVDHWLLNMLGFLSFVLKCCRSQILSLKESCPLFAHFHQQIVGIMMKMHDNDYAEYKHKETET